MFTHERGVCFLNGCINDIVTVGPAWLCFAPLARRREPSSRRGSVAFTALFVCNSYICGLTERGYRGFATDGASTLKIPADPRDLPPILYSREDELSYRHSWWTRDLSFGVFVSALS